MAILANIRISIRNVITIAQIYTKWVIRNPLTYFFMTVFMPISLMLPILLIVSTEYITDVIVGTLLYTVIVSALSDASQDVSRDRFMGTMDFYLTRNIRPTEYVFGIAFANLGYTSISTILVIVVAFLILGPVLSPFGFLIFCLILLTAWFISSLLGFIIGLYGPHEYRINIAVTNFVAFALVFLSPTYYPLEILPTFLQYVAYIPYVTYLSLMMKSLVRGTLLNPLWVLVTIFIIIGCLLITLRGLKWRQM